MKSEKGITLMSLLIYVIAFLMVTGIIGSITTFFYSNYSFLDKKTSVSAEYSKLNLTFSEENKAKGNSIYDIQSGQKSGILSKTAIDALNVEEEYETKYDLLEALNNICKQYFNTYVIFNDENVIGWRSDEKTIYYNQSVLCSNVENLSITKTIDKNHTILNVYVEFGNKSFSTKYTF